MTGDDDVIVVGSQAEREAWLLALARVRETGVPCAVVTFPSSGRGSVFDLPGGDPEFLGSVPLDAAA